MSESTEPSDRIIEWNVYLNRLSNQIFNISQFMNLYFDKTYSRSAAIILAINPPNGVIPFLPVQYGNINQSGPTFQSCVAMAQPVSYGKYIQCHT